MKRPAKPERWLSVDEWRAEFGPGHHASAHGAFVFRKREWHGVLHVVARPGGSVRGWVSFHAVRPAWGGLALARAVFAGDVRTPVKAVPGRPPPKRLYRLRTASPSWSLGLVDPIACPPPGWGSLVPGMGWGRLEVPRRFVWQSMGDTENGTPERAMRVRVFGPMRNALGAQYRNVSARFSEPPEWAIVPRIFWQPTASRNGKRAMNAAERERQSVEKAARWERYTARRHGYPLT